MDLARVINGSKYMWDKVTYEDKKSADDAVKKYRDDEFETEALQEEVKKTVRALTRSLDRERNAAIRR